MESSCANSAVILFYMLNISVIVMFLYVYVCKCDSVYDFPLQFQVTSTDANGQYKAVNFSLFCMHKTLRKSGSKTNCDCFLILHF